MDSEVPTDDAEHLDTSAVPDREHPAQETAVLNLVFSRQGRPANRCR